MKVNIAIDGPAGAGKSTVARRVATELGLCYLDTGAMYRAVTHLVIARGIDPEDENRILILCRDLCFDLDSLSHLTLNGQVVGEEVRTPEVSRLVSLVSSHAKVRESIVSKQRYLAQRGGIVMDGRDIGTTVMTNAELKIFLTADLLERARRRAEELLAAGYTVQLEELAAQIEARDHYDSTRAASPLRPAEDAITIDTTHMTLGEVVQEIVTLVKQRVGYGT